MTSYDEAKDPHTPAEVLTKLATNTGWNIRRCVSQNPNTPAQALIILAEDDCEDIRFWVNKHPNCPAAVRLWFKMEGFAGLTLAEFVEKVGI
jgi:hypothetical protein